MDNGRSTMWPDEPAVVVSHAEATDQIGHFLEAAYRSCERFRFLPSSEGVEHELSGALTSVLDVRRDLAESNPRRVTSVGAGVQL